MIKNLGFITLSIATAVLCSGCITTSGYYTLDAYNASGELLNKNVAMQAQGSGIYSARNTLCRLHPKATIIIKEIKTKEELSSESPYQCP